MTGRQGQRLNEAPCRDVTPICMSRHVGQRHSAPSGRADSKVKVVRALYSSSAKGLQLHPYRRENADFV